MGLPFSIQSRDNTLLIGDQWFEVDFHLIMNNVRKQWYYNWISVCYRSSVYHKPWASQITTTNHR